jgi:hypothetical protein
MDNQPIENVPKKRGRKKKVIENSPINSTENSNEKEINKSSLHKISSSGSIENDNSLLNDKELTQIEQVKKKRGRKKKWEVETKTTILDNTSINFIQNEQSINIPDTSENYNQKHISFGNLNIKVHSNKDNNHISDIKNILKQSSNKTDQFSKSNKNSQNSQNSQNINFDKNIPIDNKSNNKCNNNCNIDLTESDVEDFEIEYSSKNIKKQQIFNKNIKVMKYYQDIYDSGQEILISKCKCYHCHHNFSNKPFFLPIDYSSELKRYKITGNFCSPNCAKAYAFNSKKYDKKTYLIPQMYRELFGAHYYIKPAPPIQCLKDYGGSMTIEQFRNTFKNDVNYIYDLKDISAKLITDEIIVNKIR